MSKYNDERKIQIMRYWVDNPSLTYEQIAKDMKVSSKTFYLWRRDKWFMEKYHELCKERFKTLQALAVEKLGEQVKGGSFNAVKYVLDSQGYNATQKIETNTPTIITVSIEGDQGED